MASETATQVILVNGDIDDPPVFATTARVGVPEPGNGQLHYTGAGRFGSSCGANGSVETVVGARGNGLVSGSTNTSTLPERSRMAKRYWLMKSEPDVYSIDDLKRDGSTCWEGVRNYKARNNMRAMQVGDEVLYYHSNAKPPGVAGLARVCKEAYPDHFAFDKKSKYFDAKSDPDKPRWYMVDVEFVAKAREVVGLPQIKDDPALADMELVRYGRLSVQSLKKSEYDRVKKMAGL